MHDTAARTGGMSVRVWFGVLAVLGTWATVGQAVTVVTEGRSLVNFFSYFTIESNILVLVAAVVIALRGKIAGWWQPVYLAGLVGIVITGAVYHLLLAGQQTLHGVEAWYDLVLHTLVPVGSVVGFFLLRPRLERRAWWFLAWPVAWVVYTLVRGAVSDPRFVGPEGEPPLPVPYDFLDAAAVGWGQVVVTLSLIAVLAVVIAAAAMAGGRRLGR
ncbi:Pr6Pr family membrane protein [Mumia sp. ZJ1417]|uniref:Pr6Pr family membrane protein n=1 Tax=Mumia sp. ZJ1417 TaxID=2708082 RepID=UPI00141F87B8|nr:Pr6Pr family membrane protein [Mumia sp. ZJ1417]QMW67184.1 Pr6Pr family membrane protein [Mumia sp. ZJ1417]